MMKRIISAALVIMMIFALAVSVMASDVPSPGHKEYYKIEVGVEGKGTATKSVDRVKADSGDTVTFEAFEAGGFFTKWIVDGKYQLVSGDEYSTTMVVIPETDLSVVASFSAEKDYINVYTAAVPEGYGTASAEPSRIKKGSNGTSTLTAVEENGSTFQQWVLECEYDIVSGDLNSKTLVIRPYTDVYATAYFTKPGEEPTEPSTPGSSDSGSTSPRTGYPLYIMFALMGLALIGGIVATKKITE